MAGDLKAVVARRVPYAMPSSTARCSGLGIRRRPCGVTLARGWGEPRSRSSSSPIGLTGSSRTLDAIKVLAEHADPGQDAAVALALRYLTLPSEALGDEVAGFSHR